MLAILAVGTVMRVTRDLPEARMTGRVPIEARRAVIDLSAYPPPSAGSQVAARVAPVSVPAVPQPAVVPALVVEPLPEPLQQPVSLPASMELPVRKVDAVKKPKPRTQAAAAAPVPEEAMKASAVQPALAPVEKEDLVRIAIAALPWGEIYVDGVRQGVTPPVHSIQVLPGRHEIEIRNTTFPSHRATVEVGAHDRITIRHRFGGDERR
jgi:hypothetical protein